jgi:hypothetical protein
VYNRDGLAGFSTVSKGDKAAGRRKSLTGIVFPLAAVQKYGLTGNFIHFSAVQVAILRGCTKLP